MEYKNDCTTKQYLSMMLDQIGLKWHAKNVLEASPETEKVYINIIEIVAEHRSDIKELLDFSGLNLCLNQ